MLFAVLSTPPVAGILAGTLVGLSGAALPATLDWVLDKISTIAGPAALLILGMGLARYSVRAAWQQSIVVSALKLVVLPL